MLEKQGSGGCVNKMYIIFCCFLCALILCTAQTCNTFGQAGSFSVFGASQVSLQGGVIQGGVAGGKIELSFLTVGQGTEICTGSYPTNASQVSVVSSASTKLTSVTLRYGNVVSKGQVSLTASTLQTGCQQYQTVTDTNSFFDPSKTYYQLQVNSLKLSQFTLSSVSVSKGDLLFMLSSTNGAVNIFHIDAQVLANVHSFKLVGLGDTTSTVIVNVVGTTFTLNNINMQDLQKFSKQIIWNFPQATEIQLNQVTIFGTILAPYATVQAINSASTVFGSVYANSVVGSLLIYNSFFTACSNFDLSSIPNPPLPTTSSPSVSATATPTASTSAVASSIQVQALLQSQWPGGFYFQFNMQRTSTSTGFLTLSLGLTTPKNCAFTSAWQVDGQQPSEMSIPGTLRILIREWDQNRDIGGGQVGGDCIFSDITLTVAGFQMVV